MIKELIRDASRRGLMKILKSDIWSTKSDYWSDNIGVIIRVIKHVFIQF